MDHATLILKIAEMKRHNAALTRGAMWVGEVDTCNRDGHTDRLPTEDDFNALKRRNERNTSALRDLRGASLAFAKRDKALMDREDVLSDGEARLAEQHEDVRKTAELIVFAKRAGDGIDFYNNRRGCEIALERARTDLDTTPTLHVDVAPSVRIPAQLPLAISTATVKNLSCCSNETCHEMWKYHNPTTPFNYFLFLQLMANSGWDINA
tara:strand:- start:71 stop:697 length:627 start_codon:yes stop_codon:yes gene_type:complete